MRKLATECELIVKTHQAKSRKQLNLSDGRIFTIGAKISQETIGRIIPSTLAMLGEC